MKTILADDNSEIRGALRLLLRELGVQDVVETADMGETLEACVCRERDEVPGLALIDWELPVGSIRRTDPAAFVASLRQAAPGCHIIAMSARPEAEEESVRAGCDAFVSRTEPPDRLVQLILALSGLD